MLGKVTDWHRFSDEVGGAYKARSTGSGDGMRVLVHSGPWTIVLSCFGGSRSSSTSHTVVTANYVATGDLRFTIERETLLSQAAHLVGLHDLQLGDQAFDAALRVKGNDPAKIRELLADAELRALLLARPKLHLTVLDQEGLVARSRRQLADAIFSEQRDEILQLPGVHELYFYLPDHAPDFESAQGLYRLFTRMLHRLVEIGAATETDPSSL